jgi:hypothetical protein
MITLDHIPLEIDRLERETELARDSIENRRILADCMGLEQDVAVHEQRLASELERLGKIRNRIQRLRAYLS